MSDLEIHSLARCSWCGGPFVKGEVVDASVWLCAKEACWKRQVAHAMVVSLKGGKKHCRFVPLPRQVEAIEVVQDPNGPTYLLIGGAAGSGRATGGFFLPQAPADSATTRIAIAAQYVCLIASLFSP